MVQWGVFATLLLLGYGFGRLAEKKHFRVLIRREKEFLHIPVIAGEWKGTLAAEDEGALYGACVVVGSDYFKVVISGIKNIFGGRLTAYESLLDRGRREAILRVKEKAAQNGCHQIINLRIETCNLNSANPKAGLPCVELFAYGTGIRKRQGGAKPL